MMKAHREHASQAQRRHHRQEELKEMHWCVGARGVDTGSPSVPRLLQTLRITTPSSSWVLMGTTSPHEGNNGQQEKLSSKANR